MTDERKETDPIDLCISLFYNKSVWDVLVTNAIRPFVQGNKKIISYGIYMGETRGEHIKLVLKAEKENANAVALGADTHFKAFLSNNPSTNAPIEKKQEGFFMDYGNNSIQYGIYDDFYDHPGIIDIKKGFSDFLITLCENYGRELVDDTEELFIPLLTILYNALPYDHGEKRTFFTKFIEEEQKKYTEEQVEKIMATSGQDFMENKEALLEYLGEYIGKKEYEDASEIKWWRLISTFFQKNCTGIVEKDIVIVGEVLLLLVRTLNIRNTIGLYSLFTKTIEHLSIEGSKI
ncbi:hypothetical protein [Flagellimonas onchidii]|uniref:hypothetical protein n=1 Tax=Flagellimonas onchidii TaxID=2562684 RepID=UPI0010A62483|nr:hypothetical protein [Allomuricauda onchidii]